MRLEGDGEADNPGPGWDPFGEEFDSSMFDLDGCEGQKPFEELRQVEEDGPPDEGMAEQFGTDVVLETRQFGLLQGGTG